MCIRDSFLCRDVQCWICLYGIFPYRFSLYRRRLFRLLQNGVLNGPQLPVRAPDTFPDEIASGLQLPDAAADTVHPVLADTGKPLHRVIPFLRQGKHKGEKSLCFQGQRHIPQVVV